MITKIIRRIFDEIVFWKFYLNNLLIDMQSKAETFDGFTFKFFSTFQLKNPPSI